MEINARPSIFGNKRDDFTSTHRALLDANSAIEVATGTLLENVLHGRNYQHTIDPSAWAKTARPKVIEKIREARDAVRDIQDALERAIMDGDTD